jgi:hypothetical protein
MKDYVRTTWARAIHGDEEAPMTAYAQTKSSWARRVRSFVELPDVYRDGLKALLDNRPLPYAVLTPTYPGFIHRETEKLVFSLDRHFHVWERAKGGLTCTRYALDDIHWVESGSILLYAWIGIHGVSSCGELVKSLFRFNSVTDQLFAPFINEIRGAGGDSASVDHELEIQKIDCLCRPGFKFKNYARRSLLPDEPVIDALWQPEIRHKLLTLLGRSFYRTLAATHLLVLTDRELIVLHEAEAGPRWQADSRYGGVRVYIPLDKIASIAVAKTDANLLALSVHLPAGDCVKCLFVAAQQPAVDRFLSRVVSASLQLVVTRELVG